MRLRINTTAGSVMYYWFLRARFRNMKSRSPSRPRYPSLETTNLGIHLVVLPSDPLNVAQERLGRNRPAKKLL